MAKSLSMSKFQKEMTHLSTGWDASIAPELAEVRVGGITYSHAAMSQELQSIVAELKAVDMAATILKERIANRNLALPRWLKLQANLTSVLRNAFGEQSISELKDFGIGAPRTAARPSGDTLAIAAEKKRKTRKARGTRGKKQRLAITTTPEPTVVVTLNPASPAAAPGDGVAPPGSAPSPKDP